MDNTNPKKLAVMEREIHRIEKTLEGVGHSLAEANPARSLLGYQAEWHAHGIIYHTRNLFRHYSAFSRGVSSRASSDAEVIVMYAKSYQELLFELYALVSLCCIAMDNLRIFLRPLFLRSSNDLPKSISRILKGKTDCPVYGILSKQDILIYMIDLRNCLVHYRSFAIKDNALVIEEGKEDKLDSSTDVFFSAIGKASFRRISRKSVSVNIYLPDRIFDNTKGMKLAKFTFEKKFNLLSMSVEFARLGVHTLIMAMGLLRDIEQPVYTFSVEKP